MNRPVGIDGDVLHAEINADEVRDGQLCAFGDLDGHQKEPLAVMAQEAAAAPPRGGRPPAPSGRRRSARPGDRRAAPDDEPALFTTEAGARPVAPSSGEVADDRLDLKPGDRTVLIVEDDARFARILLEMALFLHRVEANLPESKRRILQQVRGSDSVLAGRKVLIVDDDARNLFALTSLLEHHQMQVLVAENGREAIAALKEDPGVDLVLMDIMMPEMDGYDAMRAIRRIEHFRSLPIIALTAKAMKGDRQTCIQAGASDYIAKPVDTEQLLSLLRVWLYH
jgi:CheY-like chemotaxis protein